MMWRRISSGSSPHREGSWVESMAHGDEQGRSDTRNARSKKDTRGKWMGVVRGKEKVISKKGRCLSPSVPAWLGAVGVHNNRSSYTQPWWDRIMSIKPCTPKTPD